MIGLKTLLTDKLCKQNKLSHSLSKYNQLNLTVKPPLVSYLQKQNKNNI